MAVLGIPFFVVASPAPPGRMSDSLFHLLIRQKALRSFNSE